MIDGWLINMEVVPPGVFGIITTCCATPNSATSLTLQVKAEQKAAPAANPMIAFLFFLGAMIAI